MKRHVRADWEQAILVCRKCSRKVGGGFGKDGETSLVKLLRKAIGGGKGRRARIGIVEVGCLKVCPKRAVVAIDTRRPGDWMLIEAGTAIDDVLVRLTPPAPDQR